MKTGVKKIIAALAFSLAGVGVVSAQEARFERLELSTRSAEKGNFYVVSSVGSHLILQGTLTGTDGTERHTAVSVRGKKIVELFDPYRDQRAPYFTDVKYLAYGDDKLVVTVRNAGPGAVHSVWITDGTAAGTREIAQIDPGAYPKVVNDGLIAITEDNSIRLLNLKTGVVSEIAAASSGGYLGGRATFADGRLMFQAGSSVFISDGSVAGTQVLLQGLPISAGLNSVNGREAQSSESSRYRVLSLDPVSSDDSFVVSDGTAAGTHLLPEALFEPQCGEGFASTFGVQIGDRFVYTHCTPEFGRELWAIDLATGQAGLVSDIRPGSASSAPKIDYYSLVNGKIFFSAYDDTNGRELWVSDGTSEGTHLVSNLAEFAKSSLSYDYAVSVSVGKHFVFQAYPQGVSEDSVQMPETWVSDGTTEGTFRIADTSIEPLNDNGVLTFPFTEEFGIKVPGSDEISKWQRGIFLKFFDPSLGAGLSKLLVTVKGEDAPLQSSGPLLKIGGYYYLYPSQLGSSVSELLVAPDKLCPQDDFKPTPGQCGCGVEELPADGDGGVVQDPNSSDGSVVCLTPIGPIFVPNTLGGSLSAELRRAPGNADSLQIAIPEQFAAALQTVVTAPGRSLEPAAVRAGRGFKVQHQISLIIADGANKTVKKLPLRRTTRNSLTIKLGRRLRSSQRVGFQYALGAERKSSVVLQTPYKRSGALRVRSKR